MWIGIKLNDKPLKNRKEKEKKSLHAAGPSWMWFQTSWNLNRDRGFLSGKIKASETNLGGKTSQWLVVMETKTPIFYCPSMHEASELLSHCLPLYSSRQVIRFSLRPPRQFRKVSWYFYLKGRIYKVMKALNSIYYINTDSTGIFLGDIGYSQ